MTQNWSLILSSKTSSFYSTVTAEAGFNKSCHRTKETASMTTMSYMDTKLPALPDGWKICSPGVWSQLLYDVTLLLLCFCVSMQSNDLMIVYNNVSFCLGSWSVGVKWWSRQCDHMGFWRDEARCNVYCVPYTCSCARSEPIR